MSTKKTTRVEAMNPLTHRLRNGNTSKSVCLKIHHGSKEVSLACDNSLGAFVTLHRCDVRCWDDDEDVSAEVLGGSEHWDADTFLQAATEWLWSETPTQEKRST